MGLLGRIRYNLKNGLLTKIAFFLGDLHNKNRSTCLIKFGSNSILYKPHSLSSDIWFYDLLYRVVGVRKINYIDKGAYGYAEFIKQGNCLYENEIKTYYYNFGVIAGLIYYLGSIDIIADNIIAGRSMPQFIDMEAVVSPNNKRNTFLSKTIFKSSILPDEFSFQKYKMSPLFKIVPNEEDFIKVKAQL
jgi:lantibiotic modifying enzyme